jgi:steroid delta-isomerase-like uncharacterized protein
MSIEQNKTIVRRFVDQVQNQHDMSAIDELFSPDFTDHTAAGGPANLEQTKQFFAMLIQAFPDQGFTIDDQVAEGDKVVTRKTFQGTHQGAFMGIPPTGKRVAFGVIEILRLEDGKIVDHWSMGDMLGLLMQLGAFPPPG